MPEHPLHCLFAFLTMRDILIALTYIDIYFTGDAVIFARDGTLVNEQTGELSDLGKIFYAVEKGQMSEATAAFNYAELSFMFDNFYGLKEVHGIESLDALALSLAGESFNQCFPKLESDQV